MAPKRKPEQLDVMAIDDLEQIKVLADPLRLRILEQLGKSERTTKQVADALGERPTRLYHHIEALERVGLIRQTRQRQNRGTLEKYYIAVARMFRAREGLFATRDLQEADRASMVTMVTSVFDNTVAELRGMLESGKADCLEEEAILTYAELHTDEKGIARIRKGIQQLLEDLKNECAEESSGGDDAPEADARRYRLTLAFFPLDVPSDAGDQG